MQYGPVRRRRPIRGGTDRIRLDDAMLRWAFGFLIVALIAAGFGFSGLATATFSIAEILVVIFVVLFVVTLAMGLISGRRSAH